jgi:DNA-binding XRE family transcriptional regulator
MSDPAEHLARELLREASFLPERWRLWLLGQLREEYKAADLEQERINQINQQMTEAVAILQMVARHLKLTKTEDQLRLTMREFDAVPVQVRESWSARRIADAVRGRWGFAKAVAFTDKRLPVVAERRWELGKNLARKQKEAAFTLSALEAWLETAPEKKTRDAYDQWAKQQDRKGQRPLPGQWAIWKRWRPVGWREILKAVEAGQVPGEDKNRLGVGETVIAERQSALRARRLRQARKDKGLTQRQVAELAGIDNSSLGKIEKGAQRQPGFETIAKLAEILGLSLDDFVTADD